MWTRFMSRWISWFQPSFAREAEHALNRARHKALYHKRGRIKPRRYYQRPPNYR